MKNILITGATGNFGRAAIDFLLKRGIQSKNIIALVRNEKKAHDLKEKGIAVEIGDYSSYDSLVAAFKKADKLLFISSSDPMHRHLQHQNVIRTAKEADVKHLIYTSFQRKNDNESSPIAFIADAHV